MKIIKNLHHQFLYKKFKIKDCLRQYGVLNTLNSNYFEQRYKCIRAVLYWFIQAQLAWKTGGISARYKFKEQKWQGPYPETTGYLIPSLLSLSQIPQFSDARSIAVSAAEWLASRQRSDGAVRCNVELPENTGSSPDEIIIFDLGAILQGFTSIATVNRDYQNNAEKLAEFIINCQGSDGIWHNYLYFDYFGTHNSLVAYSLINAGIIFGENKYIAAGEACLRALIPNFRKNGFIDFCSFQNSRSSPAFLHPFVYSIEGFLKTAEITKDDEWLQPIKSSLKFLKDDMERTGKINVAYYNENLERDSEFAATTANAQIADCWLRYSRLTGDDNYIQVAKKTLDVLCQLVMMEGQPGYIGAIPASYPVNGGYGSYTVNNWTLKYFLDACIQEMYLEF